MPSGSPSRDKTIRSTGRAVRKSATCPDMRQQGRINVIPPESTGKAGSRHDAVVDEAQRRDLLRRVEDEVRGVGREYGWDSPQARAKRRRQLGLERSTAAELGLP